MTAPTPGDLAAGQALDTMLATARAAVRVALVSLEALERRIAEATDDAQARELARQVILAHRALAPVLREARALEEQDRNRRTILGFDRRMAERDRR